jgi:hypothetical protein
MSQYLDYERLLQNDVTAAVYDFLVRVYGQDEEREAKAGFPRFFSDELAEEPVAVHLTALAKRAAEIKRYESDRRDILEFTCKWFGIKLLDYAGVADKQSAETISLPPDFKLDRPQSYDGLTDDSEWIIKGLPDRDGKPIDVLVLDVLIVDPRNQKANGGVTFYFTGIPADRVRFDTAPVDQTDEERFY